MLETLVLKHQCNISADHHSVMMILVNGEESGHLEMMHHVVVQRIIAEKWRVFVKVMMFMLGYTTCSVVVCTNYFIQQS